MASMYRGYSKSGDAISTSKLSHLYKPYSNHQIYQDDKPASANVTLPITMAPPLLGQVFNIYDPTYNFVLLFSLFISRRF